MTRLPEDPVVAVVDGFTHGGEGVVRLDGKAVFVPGALPGERVRVVVTDDRRRWARARLVEVLGPAPERVEPPCPVAEVCGGCDLQHVTPEGQRALKTRVVVEQLERLGGITDPPVADTVAVGPALGYRTVARLHADPDGRLGYHRARSNDVVPVATCPILAPATQAVRAGVGDATGAAEVTVRATSRGDRGVVLRPGAGPVDLDAMALDGGRSDTAGPDPTAGAAGLAADGGAAGSGADGGAAGSGAETPAAAETEVAGPVVAGAGRSGRLSVSLGKADGSRVAVVGDGTVTERVAGLDFTLDVDGFFQANTAGAAHLVDLVLASVGDVEGVVAWDLYAGVGLFSLPLARAGAKVTAVEGVAGAVDHLRGNAARAGLADRVWASAMDVAAFVRRREVAPDVVVLDPPRTGAGQDVVTALAGHAPGDIVYVACDPAALARDARVLASHGYRLVSAQPVDLFPMTHHVEVVAHFQP